MIWGIFIGCTTVTVASIPLLFLECCSILSGIAMSIVAAYIFYIIMQFIPSLVEEYRKRSAMAITYRKLQLMLYRLDALFIEPYNTVNGKATHNKVSLRVEEFYDKNNLLTFLQGFDLSQDSNLRNSNRVEPYSIFLQTTWMACQQYANEALMTPYLQNDSELAYQIQYLLSDSAISGYFKILQIIPTIGYECVVALNQKDKPVCKETLNNIIVLHKKIFDMYDKLKRNKRFTNIFEPSFYVNVKGKKNGK